MSKDNNIALLAIIAGAAIGAGIGILLAPEKGSLTRQRVKGGVDDSIQRLKENLQTTAQALQEKLNYAKQDPKANYSELLSTMNYKTDDDTLFI